MSRHGAVNTTGNAIVPVTASEWRWLGLAIVLGAAIRLMYLDRVAVEHFDEGVYAANVWFGADEGYQYPLRQFYAPPLLPTLIEWCYIIWGMTGMQAPAWLPMVPSLVCGIATIPSAWWIARRWFGPATGYAAMWLVALNEFHAAYSRTALTDVPVTLAILWAVFAAWRLLLDPTIRNGIVTGILIAIAWWLKYSGWLPLAILVVGGAVFQCLIRPEERRWKAWTIATAVAVLTAGVLWIPVYRDCLAVGGYSAVAANHRGYIMGWSHWTQNFIVLAEKFGAYSTLTMISLAVATHPIGKPFIRTLAVGLLFTLFAFMNSIAWLLLVAVVICQVGYVLLLWKQALLAPSAIAAASLSATWFFGLLVTTPLYHPYPRLLMPWWIVVSLVCGWGISRWQTTRPNHDLISMGGPQELREIGADPHRDSCVWRGFRRTGTDLASLVWGAVLLAVLLGVISHQRVWESRHDFRIASFVVAKKIDTATDTAIVSVYGLPPVVLALRERGVAAVVCAGPEAAARLEGSWLVVSSDADRDFTWNGAWPNVADRFELVSTIPIQPSSIVRLDHGPLPNDPPPVEVRLYRRR